MENQQPTPKPEKPRESKVEISVKKPVNPIGNINFTFIIFLAMVSFSSCEKRLYNCNPTGEYHPREYSCNNIGMIHERISKFSMETTYLNCFGPSMKIRALDNRMLVVTNYFLQGYNSFKTDFPIEDTVCQQIGCPQKGTNRKCYIWYGDGHDLLPPLELTDWEFFDEMFSNGFNEDQNDFWILKQTTTNLGQPLETWYIETEEQDYVHWAILETGIFGCEGLKPQIRKFSRTSCLLCAVHRCTLDTTQYLNGVKTNSNCLRGRRFMYERAKLLPSLGFTKLNQTGDLFYATKYERAVLKGFCHETRISTDIGVISLIECPPLTLDEVNQNFFFRSNEIDIMQNQDLECPSNLDLENGENFEVFIDQGQTSNFYTPITNLLCKFYTYKGKISSNCFDIDVVTTSVFSERPEPSKEKRGKIILNFKIEEIVLIDEHYGFPVCKIDHKTYEILTPLYISTGRFLFGTFNFTSLNGGRRSLEIDIMSQLQKTEVVFAKTVDEIYDMLDSSLLVSENLQRFVGAMNKKMGDEIMDLLDTLTIMEIKDSYKENINTINFYVLENRIKNLEMNLYGGECNLDICVMFFNSTLHNCIQMLPTIAKKMQSMCKIKETENSIYYVYCNTTKVEIDVFELIEDLREKTELYQKQNENLTITSIEKIVEERQEVENQKEEFNKEILNITTENEKLKDRMEDMEKQKLDMIDTDNAHSSSLSFLASAFGNVHLGLGSLEDRVKKFIEPILFAIIGFLFLLIIIYIMPIILRVIGFLAKRFHNVEPIYDRPQMEIRGKKKSLMPKSELLNHGKRMSRQYLENRINSFEQNHVYDGDSLDDVHLSGFLDVDIIPEEKFGMFSRIKDKFGLKDKAKGFKETHMEDTVMETHNLVMRTTTQKDYNCHCLGLQDHDVDTTWQFKERCKPLWEEYFAAMDITSKNTADLEPLNCSCLPVQPTNDGYHLPLEIMIHILSVNTRIKHDILRFPFHEFMVSPFLMLGNGLFFRCKLERFGYPHWYHNLTIFDIKRSPIVWTDKPERFQKASKELKAVYSRQMGHFKFSDQVYTIRKLVYFIKPNVYGYPLDSNTTLYIQVDIVSKRRYSKVVGIIFGSYSKYSIIEHVDDFTNFLLNAAASILLSVLIDPFTEIPHASFGNRDMMVWCATAMIDWESLTPGEYNRFLASHLISLGTPSKHVVVNEKVDKKYNPYLDSLFTIDVNNKLKKENSFVLEEYSYMGNPYEFTLCCGLVSPVQSGEIIEKSLSTYTSSTLTMKINTIEHFLTRTSTHGLRKGQLDYVYSCQMKHSPLHCSKVKRFLENMVNYDSLSMLIEYSFGYEVNMELERAIIAHSAGKFHGIFGDIERKPQRPSTLALMVGEDSKYITDTGGNYVRLRSSLFDGTKHDGQIDGKISKPLHDEQPIYDYADIDGVLIEEPIELDQLKKAMVHDIKKEVSFYDSMNFKYLHGYESRNKDKIKLADRPLAISNGEILTKEKPRIINKEDLDNDDDD